MAMPKEAIKRVRDFRIISITTTSDWRGILKGRLEVRSGKLATGRVLYSVGWCGSVEKTRAFKLADQWIERSGLRSHAREWVLNPWTGELVSGAALEELCR